MQDPDGRQPENEPVSREGSSGLLEYCPREFMINVKRQTHGDAEGPFKFSISICGHQNAPGHTVPYSKPIIPHTAVLSNFDIIRQTKYPNLNDESMAVPGKR